MLSAKYIGNLSVELATLTPKITILQDQITELKHKALGCESLILPDQEQALYHRLNTQLTTVESRRLEIIRLIRGNDKQKQ